MTTNSPPPATLTGETDESVKVAMPTPVSFPNAGRLRPGRHLLSSDTGN